jgi:lipopolysaccharide assembly protein A
MNTKELMPKIKMIVLLSLAVLAIIVVLQNTQEVAARLLFVTVSMPMAALLALTLLVGFAVGVLAALRMGKRS